MKIIDLSWLQLFYAYVLFFIPVAILTLNRTGLTRAMLWAIVRMSLQLFAVGIYLKYLFLYDYPWLNLLWLLLSILVTAYTIVKRAQIPVKKMLLPVFASTMISIVAVVAFLMLMVIQLENPFTARYLIPIAGMLAGNSLTASIVGLRTFHRAFQEKKNDYLFYLACGATRIEATREFIKEALLSAISPAIATMATIGLVALPGMMTGQILGGSSPDTAIRYQMMIMVGIFTSTVISVYLSLLFTSNKVQVT